MSALKIGRAPIHRSIDATRIRKLVGHYRAAEKYPYVVWDMTADTLVTAHHAIRAAQRSRLKAWRRRAVHLVGIYRYNDWLDAYVYMET